MKDWQERYLLDETTLADLRGNQTNWFVCWECSKKIVIKNIAEADLCCKKQFQKYSGLEDIDWGKFE